MTSNGSIFLDFNLPNATSWFLFSWLLAIALFFKFARLLSIRNWDVLTLFLLVPGLLLLQESHARATREAALAAGRVAQVAQGLMAPGLGVGGAASLATATDPYFFRPAQLVWFAYLWLLAGSAYFFGRCLVDLALTRRPVLNPNLNRSGLAWLGSALFVCLVAVALRQPGDASDRIGKGSAALDQAERRTLDLVNQQALLPFNVDAPFWVGRSLAILCHLAIVVGLVVVGRQHFQDLHTGVAAAAAYLLLPYTAFHVGQLHHVWPMSLMVWAVAAYRRPRVSGTLLGLAAGSAYFPIFVFPVWFGLYRRRGAGRFTLAFSSAAALSLGIVGAVLWAEGDLRQSVNQALTLSDWQAWKIPTTEGFWLGLSGTGLHWAYRLPVFVAYLTFVLATAFWPAPKNLAHVLALSTAALIGIQFWHADQGGVYVLWYLPFLLLMVFRPNLTERVPPLPASKTFWFVRLGRGLGRKIAEILKAPEAPVRVP